jgi:hypothetical protein
MTLYLADRDFFDDGAAAGRLGRPSLSRIAPR